MLTFGNPKTKAAMRLYMIKQMKTVIYNANVLLLNRNRQGSVVTLWCVKLRNESKAGCIFCEA